MGVCNPEAVPDKRELITPDCTGSFLEGGFQFALDMGHGHNRVPFFPSRHPSPPNPKVILICFHAQALYPDCFTN